MSAEPQPNAAAILDTLNEITRELEDGAKNCPFELPVEKSVRMDRPGGRATGAVMPRVEMERLTEPVARAPSAGRCVVIGVFVALAYVAILAVAGLFISRAVNPIGNGTAGTSLGDQASAAFSAVMSKFDALVHRRGGDAAPMTIGPAAVLAPIEAPPRVEAAPPVAAPAASAPPPLVELPLVELPRQDAVETEAASPALSLSPSDSAALPRTETAAPAVQSPSAPAQPSASELPRAAAVEPAAIAAPAPAPVIEPPRAPAATAVVPPEPGASGQELRALGNDRLQQGDVASARLFYERAADAGDARAALLLGGTYDFALLEQLGVRGMRGDVAQAASWYRRARDLGEPGAETRLQALPPR